MNLFQQQMWDDLLQAVDKCESFMLKDVHHVPTDTWYRLFNYRIASYSDWLLNQNTFNCRGTMFRIALTENGVAPLALACLPPRKFFNLEENPLVMGLNMHPSNIRRVTLKMDGSMVSSYLDPQTYNLWLKTKGSLSSEQAVAAMALLNEERYAKLMAEIHELAMRDCTVNMEYMAPDNRVVLGYMEPNLTVFQIRNNMTGEAIYYGDINRDKYPAIIQHWVEFRSFDDPTFVNQIPGMTGVEGFVFELKDGTLIKTKTDWYIAQHRAKDSINSPRRLLEVVVNEASDDLKSLLRSDPLAIKLIEEMELKVKVIYSDVVKNVEGFYNANKQLIRKDYAIKGQAELEKKYFGLAMTMYLGKDVDYKTFILKHYKEFGIKDEDESTGNEE